MLNGLARILKSSTPKQPNYISHVASASPHTIHLPLEIYRLIFSFLPSAYPLLWVSHLFKDEAEPMLYQKIDLTGDTIRHAKRRIRLFKHLAGCERIAKVVRVMLIPTLPGELRAKERKMHGRYFIALNEALRATINLKRLTVSCFSPLIVRADTFDHPAVLLADCTFQLEFLSIQNLYVRDCPWQNDLKELDVRWGFVTGSGKNFPNLSTLHVTGYGKWDYEIVFAAESNIRALYWPSARPLSGSATSSRVTALRMTLTYLGNIALLCRPFPLLRYLQIDFGFFTTDAFNRQIFQVLCNMEHLKKLHMVQYGNPAPRSTWGSTIYPVFEMVPSLQTLSIGYLNNAITMEWHKGEEDAGFVTTNDEEWKSLRWREI